MNKEQQAVLKRSGFIITDLPGLVPIPKITMYARDRTTGKVRAMPGLPADPYSLERYVKKGFKPRLEDFEQGEFTCSICGKEFKAQIGLTGHMKSHTKKEV